MNITKTLFLALFTLTTVQDELLQELSVIEESSKDVKVYLPSKEVSEKKIASKKSRNKDENILDLESEIRQEEIRLQRAAPRRIKRQKDIYKNDEADLEI